MIKSMTGFGRSENNEANKNIIVEIKSVNSRFFDFSCKTPRNYQFLEEKLKNYIQKYISRGKVEVDVFLTIDEKELSDTEISVNHSLAASYVKALSELKSTYNLSGEIDINYFSRFPDILIVEKKPQDEDEIWNCVLKSVDSALNKFIKMRADEGERMKNDFDSRIKSIYKILDKIEKKMPDIILSYRRRLEAKIRELLNDKSIDDQRLITEVAIFADKVAIDEETVRLRSHLKEFKKMLESDDPVGRKLDFLLQEMNREINTIGSKVQDLEASHMVVDIKAILEKIREQVQNIE